jgi:C-terminal processing protease CtpA/Prc
LRLVEKNAMKFNAKNVRLIFILAVILIGCGPQQEPKQYTDYSSRSGFSVANVDSVNVENLTVLAKVWGFAKYHHPVFADSTLNADYELFELLPRVATATKDERNAVLADWVAGLGEFKSAEKKLRRQIADKNYTTASDTAWLEDEALLGAGLSETLKQLRYAKRQKPSRYASYIKKYGVISFDAESDHAPFFSDTGYNLLTLFRLWNMAEYYFPSVDITNKKWADVLVEYIPKFLTATNNIKWITAELIAELSDSHSGMSNNPAYGDNKLPVEFGFVEGKLIVTHLIGDKESVFEPGDEIVSIDGKTPEYFVERTRRYTAASNENVLLRKAADVAKSVSSEKTSVVIRRGDRQVGLDITSTSLKEFRNLNEEWLKNKTYYELLNDSVGYLYPAKFNNADGAAIMKKFADTQAIIIDMRCYPTKDLLYFIVKYFIPRKTHTVTWTMAVPSLPGYFVEAPVSWPVWWMWKTWGCKDDYKGKVAVLVNAETQSMAEYMTMIFQANPNCVVVGSQTAGADGSVVYMPLPGGIKTLFSGIGVYYPDGTNAQRAGVKIDHYVTPTIEGIRANRDRVLEKALEIIKN